MNPLNAAKGVKVRVKGRRKPVTLRTPAANNNGVWWGVTDEGRVIPVAIEQARRVK